MKDSSIKRRSKFVFVSVLLIGSLVLSLILGEIFLRLFFPQRLYYNISQWDPYVGFTLIPNIEGYSKTDEYVMHMKINSRGLRDREFEFNKPKKTFRIGVFGDSFTFGEGVQNDEAYPKILEYRLNNDEGITSLGVNIQVLNFGIGKTGTSHQLAWYQKEGKKYELDMVLVGFLSGNDFVNNQGGVFYLKDDQLIHNPKAYSSVRKLQKIAYRLPFYSWLANHSHLANLFRKAATIYDDRRRQRRSEPNRREDIDGEQMTSLANVQLTIKIIEKLQEETSTNKSDFLIVHLHCKRQKVLSDYSQTEKIPTYVSQWESLHQYLREKNIKTLDLVSVFSSLSESQYYFVKDGHMRKSGHHVAAEHIHEFILPAVMQSMKEKESVVQSGNGSTATGLDA